MTSLYSNNADKTASQRFGGTGMSCLLLFMCGHKGSRPGALLRGNMPWRCAACCAARKAAA